MDFPCAKQNGYLESGELHLVGIRRDGPVGKDGTRCWVCSDHRDLISKWNSAAITEPSTLISQTKEISRVHWADRYGSAEV